MRKSAVMTAGRAPAPAMEPRGGVSAGDFADADGAANADKAKQVASLGPGQGQGGGGGGAALKPVSKPLLIYTANMNLAVFEAVKSIAIVEKMARDRGGYLVKRTDISITVRVPAEIFHTTVEEVAKLGDVTQRDISAQDVTAEFRDLEVRLKNLEVVRNRLAKLLDQAKNVKEALAVERELERVTGLMEQIKGKLKLFSELVAFSTINLNFQARPTEKVDSKVELPFYWLRDMGLPRLLQL